MNRDHEGEELLILFADLDHLKEINDSFGHIEGDFSIRHCAEVLKKVVEQMVLWEESAEMNSALSRWEI